MSHVPLPSLATEQIYDALFDDDAYEQLPDLLARSVGARSAALLWRNRIGEVNVMNHNGYFTDAHYADYAANYAHGDPWIPVAYRPQRMGLAIRMDEEVDASTVRNTAFYADWLRGMGDDTLHCLGAATTSQHGDGIIGLQRGATASGPFTAEEAGHLTDALPHLTRLMALRGKLAAATKQTRRMEEALDATGLAMIAVDRDGQVYMTNTGGDAMLRNGQLPSRNYGGVLAPCSDLARAIAEATRRAAPRATAVMVSLSGGQRVAVNVTPFAGSLGRRLALLLFRDQIRREARGHALRQLFAFTSAEAEVALSLADGESPADIAAARGTSLETVRSQLRVIKSKTFCHRQAELATLINNLPI